MTFWLTEEFQEILLKADEKIRMLIIPRTCTHTAATTLKITSIWYFWHLKFLQKQNYAPEVSQKKKNQTLQYFHMSELLEWRADKDL